MIKYPTGNQEYQISDKIRQIRFSGRMIGKASTRREGGGPRWTDITIYVTEAGKYVIQREGISLVYHRADSSCRGGELVTNSQITEDSVPCSICRPPDLDTLDEILEAQQRTEGNPAQYRREVTMSSADVAEDPSKIVTILTYQGRLTTVATEAIRRAIENDPRLEGIFDRVETIA